MKTFSKTFFLMLAASASADTLLDLEKTGAADNAVATSEGIQETPTCQDFGIESCDDCGKYCDEILHPPYGARCNGHSDGSGIASCRCSSGPKDDRTSVFFCKDDSQEEEVEKELGEIVSETVRLLDNEDELVAVEKKGDDEGDDKKKKDKKDGKDETDKKEKKEKDDEKDDEKDKDDKKEKKEKDDEKDDKKDKDDKEKKTPNPTHATGYKTPNPTHSKATKAPSPANTPKPTKPSSDDRKPDYCERKKDYNCWKDGHPKCCKENGGVDCPSKAPKCDVKSTRKPTRKPTRRPTGRRPSKDCVDDERPRPRRSGQRYRFDLVRSNAQCVDKNDDLYEFGEFDHVKEFSDCADACVNDVRSELLDSFRGYDWNCVDEECRCLYDKGTLDSRNGGLFDRTSRKESGKGSVKDAIRKDDYYCAKLAGSEFVGNENEFDGEDEAFDAEVSRALRGGN